MKECPQCHLCFEDDFNWCTRDRQPLIFSMTGTTLLDGRYQLEKRLGQGGMGMVFKARHVFLKTYHAIKVILPDLVGNNPQLGNRFRHEAILAASIHHRNVISVTDFGMAQGIMPFLVMEFIDGEALANIMRQNHHLSPDQVLRFIEPICAGVDAAHRMNIIHRDLKPLNIMIQHNAPINDAIKVLDFGLAKIKSTDASISMVQAQSTNFMGSPAYMAPEQWMEAEPTNRTDLYSIGIITYQMLTGLLPFQGNSLPMIMRAHIQDLPPSFAALGLPISPLVETVVRRALEKEPYNRQNTVEDFCNDLRNAITTSGKLYDFSKAPADESTLVMSNFEPQNTQPLSSIENQILTSPQPATKEIRETQRFFEEDSQRRRQEEEAGRYSQEQALKQSEESDLRRIAKETQRLLEEETARRLAEEEARRRAEDEAKRLTKEIEKTKQAQEDTRKLEEEEQKRAAQKAFIEESRQRAIEEAERIAREIEEAKKQSQEEARLRAEEEEARRHAEEERKRAEEEARLRAEEEARRLAEEERKRKEEEEQKRKEEEERLRAEQEARKRKEEKERLRAEEVRKRKEEEARLAEEEERKRKEEEERKRAEQKALIEESRRRAIEEAERVAREIEEARKQAQEEARKRKAEEKKRKEEEHRLAEEERKRKEGEEYKRKEEERKREEERWLEEARWREEQARKHEEEERKSKQEADSANLSTAVSKLSDTLASIAIPDDEPPQTIPFDQSPQPDLLQEPPQTIPFNQIPQQPDSIKEPPQTIPFNQVPQPSDISPLHPQTITFTQTQPPPEFLPDVNQTTALKMNKDFSTTSPSREDTNPSIVKPGISLFGIDLPQEHRIPLIVIGSILLFSMLVVASVGSVALYRLYQSKDSVSKTDENTQDKKDENTPPKPPNNNNLVEIQGGEFSMGTDDINQDDEYEFLQYPAHKVIVDSFLIDRTEVTNEEYAKFIAETNYKPPKDWNGNNYPPAGKEKFPVVNVSIEDADKFAKWRSERDGLQCRLPEEKEWEYAARSANNYIYPWGNGWKDDMGNVGPNTSLKPVGSYPNSGTAVGGVQDMMGNAYEWTSSKASLYENNTIAKKKGRENIEKEKNQNVYRSFGLGTNLNYKSKFLTLRAWFSPDTKKDVLGFRLVCKK